MSIFLPEKNWQCRVLLVARIRHYCGTQAGVWGDFWGDSPRRQPGPRWKVHRLKLLSVMACSAVAIRGYVANSL